MRQPLTNFTFRVLFGEDYLILTENTISIEADFAAQMVELELRDSRDNEVAKAIIDYLKGDRVLCWEVLDTKNAVVTRSNTFFCLDLVAHTMRQDYSKTEHVVQYLAFRYEECETEFPT